MRSIEREQTLTIPVDSVRLQGNLTLPEGARGLVLFAHGSGSSRHSPRNRFVADVLHRRGLATLLFDLLTLDEEALDAVDAHLRFDIPLLARRLGGATDWLREHESARDLTLGYFGSSTGAAAALIAAAERPDTVRAVVSRGGRPDLAGPALARVHTPTLLVVGGDDKKVLALNRQALDEIPGEKRLEVIPGSTHLFEEPGALGEVARLAGEWFVLHLGASREAEVPAGPVSRR
jgi:putative phosphoribosyl transferase